MEKKDFREIYNNNFATYGKKTDEGFLRPETHILLGIYEELKEIKCLLGKIEVETEIKPVVKEDKKETKKK